MVPRVLLFIIVLFPLRSSWTLLLPLFCSVVPHMRRPMNFELEICVNEHEANYCIIGHGNIVT